MCNTGGDNQPTHTQIDGVCGVFFGSDFVTVTKRDDYSWAVLKPDIFAAIMDHFAGGMHCFSSGFEC